MPRIVLVSQELTEEQAAKFPAGVLTWDLRLVISTDGDCYVQKWLGWEQGMAMGWHRLEEDGKVQRHAPDCPWESIRRGKALQEAERNGHVVDPK